MEKILLAWLILGFAGCEVLEKSGNAAEKPPETLRIVTWNVQTLFDGDETGAEYDEYRSSAGWTDEKYKARLNTLALAVEKMTEPAPDILGLMEVENPRVLEDILQGPLAKKGYGWSFFGINPGAPLGIGILSRFPFEETLLHSITLNGETAPRPMLEIRLLVKDSPLICMVCHWKSKREGEDATESLRKASARLIVRRLQELKQENPAIPVIVMGDLNENYDEFYRRESGITSALLPDVPEVAARIGDTQADFLILSGKKPPEPEFCASDGAILYSPWGEELEEGSYYFRNAWETIDHFLLSGALFDRTGWDFHSCRVIKQEPFLKDDKPYAYNPRTGNGFSDHLPLLLTLTLQ
ncbi:MAG: endonuclease/exonuclease/phosphatase family protein [Spirochaetaceae bacterium]|jgi:endonuclease/exonuclease/phosphatase family metal-dependent hydrolase|nr:endonuclease/exonuclease/phosphatase family protein [Spirochaetaceae bacterium]